MRKIVMLGALVALLVGMFATTAYAANVIYCDQQGNPCFGTAQKDTMFDAYEPLGEEIYAGRGNDVVNGDYYWQDGKDELHGNAGSDFLDGADFDTDDVLNGGKGLNDICKVDRDAETGEQDATLNCDTVRVSVFND